MAVNAKYRLIKIRFKDGGGFCNRIIEKENENKLWILIRVKYDIFVIIIRFPLLLSFPPQLGELNRK